jgi:small-conductance mechanosensitive channel
MLWQNFSTIANNIVSLSVANERPLEQRFAGTAAVRDVIEIGGNAGEISSIGIRASIIRTANGSEIIVRMDRLPVESSD